LAVRTNVDAQLDDPPPSENILREASPYQQPHDTTPLSGTTLQESIPEQEPSETPALESILEEESHENRISDVLLPKSAVHIQNSVNTHPETPESPARTDSSHLIKSTIVLTVGSTSASQHSQAPSRECKGRGLEGSDNLPVALDETKQQREQRRNSVYQTRVALARESQIPLPMTVDLPREVDRWAVYQAERRKDEKKRLRYEAKARRDLADMAAQQSVVPVLAGESASNLPSEDQLESQAAGILTTDVKGKGKLVADVAPGVSLPAKNQLENEANSIVAKDLKGKEKLVGAEVSSRTGVKPFAERGKNLFEATKLRPDKGILAQWKSSGRQVVDKRLRDLHLGQNTITNLRLSMLGSTPDEKSMKPTIFIVCSDEKKIKEIDNCLREFIKISFPDCVEFKIIAGKVKLASGPGSSLPSKSSGKFQQGLQVVAVSQNPRQTVVGTGMAIVMSHVMSSGTSSLFSSPATIGGIVNVGEAIYGLTVAHSLFGKAAESGMLPPLVRYCGWTAGYEWTGDVPGDANTEMDGHGPAPGLKEVVAMDWMLIRLCEDLMLPNQYYAASELFFSLGYEISGFLQNVDLPDGEVWVCSGFTQPQSGVLDSTPSSIIVDQVSYEVLSLALEFPLGACQFISEVEVTDCCSCW
jgi:hypothetical protein